MLVDVPDDMNWMAARPAAAPLFKVDGTAEDLGQEESKLFHCITAKLLFPCKKS
jgi:hypothetical protein